jgi:hypothetical protein
LKKNDVAALATTITLSCYVAIIAATISARYKRHVSSKFLTAVCSGQKQLNDSLRALLKLQLFAFPKLPKKKNWTKTFIIIHTKI